MEYLVLTHTADGVEYEEVSAVNEPTAASKVDHSGLTVVYRIAEDANGRLSKREFHNSAGGEEYE